jgi:hypothetical protein
MRLSEKLILNHAADHLMSSAHLETHSLMLARLLCVRYRDMLAIMSWHGSVDIGGVNKQTQQTTDNIR